MTTAQCLCVTALFDHFTGTIIPVNGIDQNLTLFTLELQLLVVCFNDSEASTAALTQVQDCIIIITMTLLLCWQL